MQQYDLNKGFIEEVRAASDIVRIVSRHVDLKKRGKNYVGLCPFHNEKTPSFNVGPERQMYYCFGCGANGDVFTFLIEHERMNFPDAVVELAREAGLKIPLKSKASGAIEAEKARMVEANDAAAMFYRSLLRSEKNINILEYLHDRGIGDATIDSFEIGYAPDSYDALQRAIGDAWGAKLMEKAGLIQPSTAGSGYIDRFRKRIIIPIRAASGRLIAFGGRTFGDGEPKYLNSPETPLFHKSRTLYGLHQGSRAIRKRGFAILVEGYFDVIMMHLFGFENAVAPLGTSLAEEHAHLLYRYCRKVIVCMDADDAGTSAAVRSAGTLLSRGFSVNIVPLPRGEDPDSFLQKQGKEAFSELLKISDPAYTYVLKVTAGKYDLSRPANKRTALNELLPVLNRVSDPIERSHAIAETAGALAVDQHLVVTELNRLKNGQMVGAGNVVQETSWLSTAEKDLLIATLADPKKCQKAVEDLEIIHYLSPFTRRMLETVFQRIGESEPVSFQQLAELARDDAERKLVAELAVLDEKAHMANSWECAVAIAIKGLKGQMDIISSKIVELEKTEPSHKDIDELFLQKMEISMRIKELENVVSKNLLL